MENQLPTIGDKIKLKTKTQGDKLCIIDKITETKIHFKNKNIGVEINKDRVQKLPQTWRGANWYYQSFN